MAKTKDYSIFETQKTCEQCTYFEVENNAVGLSNGTCLEPMSPNYQTLVTNSMNCGLNSANHK